METRDRNKYLDYCKARNKVRATTRKIRSLENKLASEIKNNPKSFWKYYRSKTTLQEGIGKLNADPLDPNSNITNDDTEKANIIICRILLQCIHKINSNECHNTTPNNNRNPDAKHAYLK